MDTDSSTFDSVDKRLNQGRIKVRVKRCLKSLIAERYYENK